MDGHYTYELLISAGVQPEGAEYLSLGINMLIILAMVILATLLVRNVLLKLFLNVIRTNRYRWDDPLIDSKFFIRVSWFVPVLLIHLSIDTLLPVDSSTYIVLKRIMKACFVIVCVLSLNALLSSLTDIYRLLRKKRPEMLQGFVDAGKIALYIIGAIFIVSIFTGTSPWGILSILGGLTAVTMLVFKDTILGFVASIQLSSIDMVRVGDWLEMPSYGADGDVISMSIHTVRVQNWDKTITTIPTYALVSNAFKNWRGMSESGGRRIKRSLYIDINTIGWCDEEMLEKFQSVNLLDDYLGLKTREIDEYNKQLTLADDRQNNFNLRRQTNIGLFRAYVIAYLKNNPHINQEMTFLVRQLSPTAEGLPLEIYVFSSEQRWAPYEAIQADIFDHLFAALPEFNLRAFQNPTGYDFRNHQHASHPTPQS
ncbi:MAG: mechanosensitive ion channel family protein [Desulfobulbaceae bacterium]|nr:MAG: mechanosensitive ion channel family protein [Desulfobulbaceae bacterium]